MALTSLIKDLHCPFFPSTPFNNPSFSLSSWSSSISVKCPFGSMLYTAPSSLQWKCQGKPVAVSKLWSPESESIITDTSEWNKLPIKPIILVKGQGEQPWYIASGRNSRLLFLIWEYQTRRRHQEKKIALWWEHLERNQPAVFGKNSAAGRVMEGTLEVVICSVPRLKQMLLRRGWLLFALLPPSK